MLPDGFITECCREFDRDGSRQKLIELLNKAAEVARESAYTTDEFAIRDNPQLSPWDKREAVAAIVAEFKGVVEDVD